MRARVRRAMNALRALREEIRKKPGPSLRELLEQNEREPEVRVPTLVVDANVALSWVLPDEGITPGAERLGDAVRDSEVSCAVPSIWEYETGNVITRGIRSGRLTDTEGRIRHGLFNLRLKVHGFEAIADLTWELALRYGLTFYDASYLALAKLLGCECFTNDTDMIKAAAALRPRPLDRRLRGEQILGFLTAFRYPPVGAHSLRPHLERTSGGRCQPPWHVYGSQSFFGQSRG